MANSNTQPPIGTNYSVGISSMNQIDNNKYRQPSNHNNNLYSSPSSTPNQLYNSNNKQAGMNNLTMSPIQ